jgi:hypothetical protein
LRNTIRLDNYIFHILLVSLFTRHKCRVNKTKRGLMMEAHSHNPCYLEGGDWEDGDLRPAEPKDSEISAEQTSRAWCYMSLIPATQEA